LRLSFLCLCSYLYLPIAISNRNPLALLINRIVSSFRKRTRAKESWRRKEEVGKRAREEEGEEEGGKVSSGGWVGGFGKERKEERVGGDERRDDALT
jgi:hypothetical protein